MRTRRRYLCLVLMMLPMAASAQIRVSEIVGDGMVIQRGAPVPLAGRAPPGARVEVALGAESVAATADAAGRWEAVLPPRSAGGPYDLTVSGGGDRLAVRDVWVGDVWLASGQSNMEWPVSESTGAEAVVAGATDRQIRHFKVPRSWSEGPAEALAGGDWRVASPEHVAHFSAVAYAFARALREHVGVPIGIIDATWGGSRIEPWMSAEALGLDPAGLVALRQEERQREGALRETLRVRIGGLPEEDRGMEGAEPRWASPAFADDEWDRIPVPSPWEQAGYDGLDGVGWYRTAFELTAEEAAAGVTLGLGRIDDSDVTWVNGVEVGRMDNAWTVPRLYPVPPTALRPGRNVVAVRVEDFQGGGGIAGSPQEVYLEVGGVQRPLSGDWRFRVGRVSLDADSQKNQVPTVLYNRMIHPLRSFPVRGVLWYQGESNAGSAEEAAAYRRLFPALIEDWRGLWGQELPFLFVQLASFEASGAWPLLREAQSAALALPGTAQVVTIDVGDRYDIHPTDKQTVGERLARAARRVAYGEAIEHSGPVYTGHEVRSGAVHLTFSHRGRGLAVRGGGETVRGFEVAGADRRFVPAEARIEGGRVVVRSDAVPEPLAVRYAWEDSPDTADLVNVEGLPASPFRTDDW